jgi:hypothetical protein
VTLEKLQADFSGKVGCSSVIEVLRRFSARLPDNFRNAGRPGTNAF